MEQHKSFYSVPCPHCGNEYSDKKGMRRHVKYHCPMNPEQEPGPRPDNKKMSTCPVCHEYHLSRELKGHIARKHDGIVPGTGEI